ncbi:AcrVA2 family anti-CRISPR protein [Leptospira weilii]|uniref:Uncharacterized protein n=1 Tax=Leptospira weilii str. UI 13098 TaxID=1088542 RepID=M6QH12_9LEPT|nr:hypothetical protein [Leptospira weilii]EMN92550.1 hypothetical protein LEP1GSC108_0427 [Leptospira weilii str. UI 13098]OMI16188.1 hypothetical protein BUQ74_16695 [Leptospira weilii serovar Heyan]
MKTSRRQNSKKQKTRPENICNKVLSDFPNWRKITKNALEQKGKELPDWPNYIFAPIESYFPILAEEEIDFKNSSNVLYNYLLVNQLAALVPWSLSKGIYRFSQELFEELIDSPLPEKIPSEILKKLPQWSIYVELPKNKIQDCNGFFTFLESDKGRNELRILLDYDNRPAYLAVLNLENHTIEESFNLFQQNIKNQLSNINEKITDSLLEIYKQSQIKILKKIVPLILYICSENAEIKGSFSHSNYTQRFKEKSPSEISPASNVAIWDVGNELGERLRRFREKTQKNDLQLRSKTPHIRKAHWHHFWVGMKGSKALMVRWLTPIPVNF